MKPVKTCEALEAEITQLRTRLEDAEDALRAISVHEVDALVIDGPEGHRVFTLDGAEQPYRAFVETMNEGAITMTRDGVVLYANRRFADMVNMPLNTIIGTSLHDFILPVESEPLHLMAERCGLGGSRGEFTLKTPDNKEIATYLSMMPLEGGTSALCLTVTDLTGQKRVEQALRDSEMRHRRLVETAEEGIWAVGLDSIITFVNRKMAQMLGYTADELMGQDYTRFFIEEDTLGERRNMEERLSGIRDQYYARLRKKDGKVILCRVSACPMTDDQGHTYGAFAMLTDVTEHRRLEEQLRQAQKMEAVGTLAGGIAHDFNNVLAAIIGFTEMVIEDMPLDSPERQRLELVLKSGFRGRELVKQILTFCRKTNYERQPLLLAPLVKETVKMLRASLPATVRITAKVAPQPLVVLANPTEVQEVLMNLCTNAAHAMRLKGGRLVISLTRTEGVPGKGMARRILPGQYVRLTVQDTGTGIDAGVMERIFEPFFTTKALGEGTGMGLAVVYGIIQNLNGEITVESVPGAGSSFHVYIPRLMENHTPIPVTMDETPGGTEHILFIDDEEVLARWGKEVLERLGYQVTAMTDGMEALESFSSDPARFDLVFTDHTMPEVTGLDLAGDFLKIRPDLPVILCTGYSHEVSAETARLSGIRGFIMKPMAKHELAKVIRLTLDERS